MRLLGLLILALFVTGCNQQPPVAMEQGELVAVAETPPVTDDNCAAWTQNLTACTPYTCSYTNPRTNMQGSRQVQGLQNGKCSYQEQLPGQRMLSCSLPMNQLSDLAQYYQKVEVVDRDLTTISQNKLGNIDYSDTVEQQIVPTPLQQALKTGNCKISILNTSMSSPNGFDIQFGSGQEKENIIL